MPFCLSCKSIRESVYKYLRSIVVTPLPLRSSTINMTFDICVLWLLWVGALTNKTYNEVNIWIFCVIWPIFTILSVVLNLYLLIS